MPDSPNQQPTADCGQCPSGSNTYRTPEVRDAHVAHRHPYTPPKQPAQR